jgi:hypothetical protein
MDIFENSFQPKEGVEVEDTGDEVLIYLPGGDRTLYLNETAALVWRLCDGQRTGVEIIDLLTEAYPEAQADIQMQVQVALSDFIERGIIESTS